MTHTAKKLHGTDLKINPEASKSYTKDSVRAYLREIGRIPRLTQDEEVTLGNRVKKLMELLALRSELEGRNEFSQLVWADAANLTEAELSKALRSGYRAREKMVEANLRLVVSIAKKYLNRNMELLDMIQEGSVGLHRGVEKFDPAQGYRFSTYAYWWIRQAITRAIAEKSRNIRLPIHIVEKLNRLKKVQRNLSQRYQRAATIRELAQELGVAEKEVRRLKKLSRKTLSLDIKVGSSEGDSELIDLLNDDGQSPEDYMLDRQRHNDIYSALESLEEKERNVLLLRYGLDGRKPLTLAAVGEAMDISRERVRQIQRRALERLRKNNWSDLQNYLAS